MVLRQTSASQWSGNISRTGWTQPNTAAGRLARLGGVQDASRRGCEPQQGPLKEASGTSPASAADYLIVPFYLRAGSEM
jgi:hypothetical protein